MTGQPPPWLATRLLSRVLEPGVRDEVIGDLVEEYELRAAGSGPAAARWYWRQTLRSYPVLIGRRARRDRWMSTAAVAIGSYVVVGLLNAAGTSLVEPWIDRSSDTQYLATAMVGLAAIGSGAHLASRFRPAAGRVLGGLVAIVALLMLGSPVDASPAWYQLLFLILGPVVAYGGAAAARRHASRPGRQPS